tara:strand:- start:127 stop:468 length:342 start_codon:yes stop_codon:yes gene_type:complete
MMGPWHTGWYVERGLTRKVTQVVTTNIMEGYEPGDTLEYNEVTTHYAGGRIDIRGIPNNPLGDEYGLPVMHGKDWNAFGTWLGDFESEELVPYDSLIKQFETYYGKPIRWWNK